MGYVLLSEGKMNNNIINIIIVILTSVIIIGCQRADLEHTSMKAKFLLDKSLNKAILISSENIYDNGKIIAVEDKYDFSASCDYLRKKKKKLNFCYETIKKSYYENADTDNTDDALYVLADINNTLLFITQTYIEDPCKYIKIIKNKNTIKLSKWIYEKYFPSSFPKDYLNDWHKLSQEEKRKSLIGDLLVPITRDKKERCKE